ncbi:hypothetical protein H0W32_03200 [Patescibacteria group bacterium]|nr:hypothetical protein [Patescibacteria group bacterium]
MSNETELNTRGRILHIAEDLVNGARNVDYGDPNADFKRTAGLWEIYIQGIIEKAGGEFKLSPHDVAVMMILLKVSRLSWSPDKEDHWVDIAGYAACGADCVEGISNNHA